MRKILDTISIALLALQFLVTVRVLYGPNHFADRFPTHFDVVGHPDHWGTTSSLPVLPFLAFVLYIFISVVAAFSSMAKFPGNVTPENRPRIEELSLGLISWIKLELVGIFTCLQMTLIEAGWHPERESSELGVWLLLAAILATTAWYIAAMVRATRGDDTPLDSEGVSDNS
jgi:uncharacterized membrane protein